MWPLSYKSCILLSCAVDGLCCLMGYHSWLVVVIWPKHRHEVDGLYAVYVVGFSLALHVIVYVVELLM